MPPPQVLRNASSVPSLEVSLGGAGDYPKAKGVFPPCPCLLSKITHPGPTHGALLPQCHFPYKRGCGNKRGSLFGFYFLACLPSCSDRVHLEDRKWGGWLGQVSKEHPGPGVSAALQPEGGSGRLCTSPGPWEDRHTANAALDNPSSSLSRAS